MKQLTKKIRDRLDVLSQKVKNYKSENDKEIRDEIRILYVEIANSLKTLSDAQQELRIIAQNFKKSKTTRTDVGKFYSFVKSQTSAELDLATLLDRAWNLIVMDDFDEAIKILKKVLDIDPKNVKGLGFMCLALMDRDQYDDAMLYLQQVLILEPDNPFALNNLGYICYKKGIWGEAIEHLVKAAKQKKDRMAALYANFYLGLVYYERSMLSDAVKFFEEALKLGPNLQEAYYYLGLSEMKRYEFVKAVGYFEKCAAIDSKSKSGKLCKVEWDKIKLLIDGRKIMHKDKTGDDD